VAVGAPGPGVGALLEQDAVEPLDLHRRVDEPVTPVVDRFTGGACPRPWMREPPPAGMPEIFSTSTWASSPGWCRW